MKIDTKEIKAYIKDGSLYRLARDTEVSESLLYQYRRGDKDEENMTIKTAKIIQKYINENKK